jgi:hypothetical protein
MKKLVEKFKLKSIIAIVLLVSTVVSTLTSCFVNLDYVDVYANSNNLRQTYLDLQAGNNLNSVESIDSLTTEDLKAIAVFLSNFYIPYNTSLDSDVEDANKSQMVNALKNLGYNSDAAEQLINAVYRASLDSAQPLYINVSDIPANCDGGYSGWFDNTGANTGAALVPAYTNLDAYGKYVGNWVGNYTPVTVWIWVNVFRTNKASSSSVNDTLESATFDLCYNSDSGMKACFGVNNFSRSYVTYISSAIDISDGTGGNALLNSGLSEWKDESDSTKAALFSGTQNVYVDWVGNIIADFGDRRVILYPACMNTKTFIKIGDDATADRFNAISSWGAYMLNTAGNYSDTAEEVTMKSKSYPTYILMNYGSASQKPTWDTSAKWGKGDGGILRDWISSLGAFEIGKTYDVWDDNRLTYSSAEYTLTESNTHDKMLVYASIKSSGLDTMINNASSFYSASMLNSEMHSKFFTSATKFNTKSSDLNAFMSFSSSDYEMLSNFMITYAFACANSSSTSYDETINYIDMKFNDIFPSATSSALEWTAVDTSSDKILSFVYYLLHPTEGVSYVATLLKNKLSGFLINWHEDVVGSSDSNYTTGMTKYLGTSSYVTVPSLNDVSWLSKLLDAYDSIIVYVIIMVCLILICYILVGSMTIQRGIVGIIMFSFLAFIPPVAINAVVDYTNRISESIFSSKFDYWAICQTQGYIAKLSSIENATTVYDYIDVLLDLDTSSGEAGTSETSYSGVKVKWMSPKKVNDMASVNEEMNDSILANTFSSTFIQQLTNALAVTNSTEEYEVGALYLYRDLLDIYRYASVPYNVYEQFNYDGTLNNVINGINLLTIRGDSSNADIVTRNWDSSGHIQGNATASYSNINNLTYSSGEKYLDYIMANNEKNHNYYSTLSDAIKDTSSLQAMRRGFLYDVFTDDTSSNTVNLDSDNESYYRLQTLATTLFLGYNEEILKMVDNYYNLYGAVTGSNTINISKDNLEDASSSILFGLLGSDFDLSVNDLTGYKSSNDINNINDVISAHEELSGLYYSLYSESPFYFFSNNIRDQIRTVSSYTYDYENLTASEGSFKDLLLGNQQSYFFNMADSSADGYGELRDFMNFHDLFYYIIPALKVGNDAVDLFDETFGMYTYDDCSLTLTSSGTITYSGISGTSLKEILESKNEGNINNAGTEITVFEALTDEQKYKLWHDYNVWTLFNAYTTWLDTMEDCEYADSEKITVLGDKFTVENPLDPTSYYKTDASGNIIEGRYMVFSKSEMDYYGLTDVNLTSVEKKLIEIGESVYEQAIDLMNYYTFCDETLINSLAMIEIFEFNKEFSQESLIGEDFILYPQSYELKAFTYDAYLRLILAEASGEEIQGETSIYTRIASNTSLFFGIALLINDVFAVYLIPGLRLFFIVIIFLMSIALVLAAAFKLEMNIINVMGKSLLAPLLYFCAISIGMSWIVSLFMSNGTSEVYETSTTISLGDPTATLLVMIIINIAVVMLYWKVCKKCFTDFKTYVKAIGESVAGAVTGTLGKITGVALAGKALNRNKGGNASIASSASQRGKDNSPTSGKLGLASGALAAGALTGHVATDVLNNAEKDMLETAKKRRETSAGMNKYDKKAYDAANARQDKIAGKTLQKRHSADIAANNGNTKKAERLNKAADRLQQRANNSQQKASDIAKYGRFGALKKDIGRKSYAAGSMAKQGVDKAKYGTSRVANLASVNANKVAKAVKDPNTYFNIGSNVTKAGKTVRSIPSKAKKGATSALETAQIKGMYAADAIKSAPRNVANIVRSGVETAQIQGRYAMDKVKDTYNNGRMGIANFKDGARRAKLAYDAGRAYGGV